MKKVFLKSCSLILSLVLLVNMLPMSVFAEEFREAAQSSKAEVNTQEAVTEEAAYIVEEIAERRTEYGKEFLLSNGLHMAALYPDAIHYETENGWEEIDNTLTAKADGRIANTAGRWKVSFPQKLTEKESVTIEKDGYTLSFYMAGELCQSVAEMPVVPAPPVDVATVSAEAAMQTEPTSPAEALSLTEKVEKEQFRLAPMEQAEAEILKIDLQSLYPDVADGSEIPQKSYSRLQYSQIYPDTDVVYDLDGNKVKESVILESYRSDLRGYRYALNVGQLHPALQEDGSILFYDEAEENVVMTMPAPYLVDGEQAYSHDIDVTLTGSDGSYMLTYLLPQTWLAAGERSWPVVLDPVVFAELDVNNIQDVTVAEGKSYSYTWGMNSCGYGSEARAHRFYLRYETLPKLGTSDVILDAKVKLILDPKSAGRDTTVEVHKVNATWDPQTITWANQPGYSSLIEDYAIVREHARYSWTITDIARDWYSRSNTGVLFKASDAVENGGTVDCKQFWSSEYGTYGNRPVLEIIFRNNNGVEGYWDYTTTAVGSAGTSYINNYTGNLVYVHNDMGFDGNRMPVSISHVYNMNDLSNNDFAMGYGWRTNYHQKVYRYEENTAYYVWEDGDGTRHYFGYDSSTGSYKDEDGLEMTLWVQGSAYGSYSITDKSGGTSYFDSNGRLVRIENNQAVVSAVTITYRNNTDSHIATITDGAGRVYVFDYTDDKLTQLRYTGKAGAPLSTVSFTYDGWRMTGITKPEGVTANFGYDSTYYIMNVTDTHGYRLSYQYNTISEAHQPYRIIGISEYSSDGILGGTLYLEYSHNQTRIVDRSGNVEILQFNNWGNVTCIQDDEGRAQFAQYAKNTQSDAGSSNQLTLNSKLQNTVANRLHSSGFEGGETWDVWPEGTSCQNVTAEAFLGSHSLLFTATEWSCVMSEYLMIGAGETFTASAYVKGVSGDSTLMIVNRETMDSASVAATSGSTEWKRVEVTYTNKGTASAIVCMQIFGVAGTQVYVDCVQVEKSASASRYNMVSNGDFIYNNAHYAYLWTGNGLSGNDGVVSDAWTAARHLDGNVLSITGDPTGIKQMYQTIPQGGSAGDCYVLAGWAWTDKAVPESTIQGESETRKFQLKLTFHNSDGSTTEAEAKFNPDCRYWQYTAAVGVAQKDYTSLTVTVQYDRNANTVWFDGIQLFKEQFGTSYTYDGDGNVISVTDLQKQTTDYEYDANNNLTKILQNNKAKMTYEYDNYHNVTKATSEEGIEYQFIYNEYGINRSVSVVCGDKEINAISHFTSDLNYLADVWDPLNRKTYYDYNTETGALMSLQNPKDTEQTRTQYRYDDLYRLEEVLATTDTNLHMSAQYTYSGTRLQQIRIPGTDYNFEYDGFGLRTRVAVGYWYLAEYAYQPDTHLLDALSYHNEHSVSYTYDSKGRLTKETYVTPLVETTQQDTVYYSYDNSGNLATVTDSWSETVTRNYYDLTDRLMKYTEQSPALAHSVEYTYDAKNNMTGITESIDDRTATQSYTYDEDNRITSVTNGPVSVHYTYDGYGRLSAKETRNNGTAVKTETYTYQELYVNGRYTSGQVATHTVTTGGNAVTYHYSYDANGNITGITWGGNQVEYTYDSANQLTAERDVTGGRTQTWTYNESGNIIEHTDTARPGEEDQYSYVDSAWGDWLNWRNGQYISNDDIGNLLHDGRWNYTWMRGRQLKAMENSGEAWEFSYDATGMRTERVRTKDSVNTTWSYVYNGGQLSRMETGGDTLYFAYDADGTPMTVTHNGTVYFYVTNLQGDIVAIVDASGTTVATYSYDAWGNPQGNQPTGGIAALNPLRYRGYIYDAETGLYYVSSRYYDPEMGRWISADNQLSTGSDLTGLNLFAYCGNNPVNRIDPTGEAWRHWALGAAVVAIAAVATVVTCGGFAAAATAVCMVGSGVAATTTASTVAAGAFIGSATVYGMAVLSAASTSNSVQEFKDQGNWGTVAATAFGWLTGGYDGYTMSKAKATQTVADDDTFLPDSFYSKHAPKQSTPNSSYTNYTYNNYTGKYEKSTAYYDFAGRQNIRIDWTNHGYSNHGNPHVHYTTYNSQYRDGFTIRWD